MQLGSHARRLPVGRRHHHPLHRRLDVPAVLDELYRQPVEQLRMTGRFALGAKILGRLHDPGTEKLLPVTIDRHARSQRVLRIHQPAGQPQAVERQVGVHRRQHAGRPSAELLSPLIVFTTLQMERRTQLLALPPDECRGHLVVQLRPGFLRCLSCARAVLQLVRLRHLLAEIIAQLLLLLSIPSGGLGAHPFQNLRRYRRLITRRRQLASLSAG